MTVKILNPITFPGWDAMIVEFAGCTAFHSAAWAEVLQRSYRYDPRYFVWMEGERPGAVIPMVEIKSPLTGRRGVSLAFTDYCEPLVDDPRIFDNLFERIVEHARESGWKRVEMRGGQRFLADAAPSVSYLGHTMNLSGDEQNLLSSFRGNTRWSIRKAATEGVEIQFDTSLQSVKEFYRLHCLTRKRHGVPPQPFHFFRNIHDCILARNLGRVVLASHNKTNIAGAICFNFGNKAIYKYSASDVTYRQLCANNLVLWESIKYYSKNGCTSFCMGRTDRDNDGLMKFKNGWGTTERSINYYKYDIGIGEFVSEDTQSMSKYSRYVEMLPNPILKAMGHVIYRHMG